MPLKIAPENAIVNVESNLNKNFYLELILFTAQNQLFKCQTIRLAVFVKLFFSYSNFVSSTSLENLKLGNSIFFIERKFIETQRT